MANNSSIRSSIREQRRNLSEEASNDAAFALCERVASERVFQKSQHIGFYLPNDGEIDLTLLIEHAWQRNKTCYLPVLAEPNVKRLWFIPFYPDSTFKLNRFGIPEPVHSRKTRIKKIISLDLLLIPLVAFDTQGNRMGMGGGFYDRSLAFMQSRHAWHKPNLIGTAYEFQKQTKLNTNAWDIPLQAIATEKNFYISSQTA